MPEPLLPGARLTPRHVEQALARIGARHADRGRDAEHIYETLTWGEGPAALSQARLQHWLWHRLPTRYMTDEEGYAQRLAGVAAELFEELGVARYADICRSETTAKVHRAFEMSNGEGYKAARRAAGASGVEPPDLTDFSWGGVMGHEEADARAASEAALEAAIDDGSMAVGRRGWRDAQAVIIRTVLDEPHPALPGQSRRTAILTERASRWVDEVTRRVPSVGPLVDRVVRRVLAPPPPPPGEAIAAALAPWAWLLARLGGGQAMTAAGYLNRAFVLDVWANRPWTHELLRLDKAPRSESDDFILIALRELSQRTGTARVTKKVLRTTALGDDVVAEPTVAWSTLVAGFASHGWERFIAEWMLLHLLDRAGPWAAEDGQAAVAEIAAGMGWRSQGDIPSTMDVARGFAPTRHLAELFGFLDHSGGWAARTYRLTETGAAFATAVVHAAITGPRSRP